MLWYGFNGKIRQSLISNKKKYVNSQNKKYNLTHKTSFFLNPIHLSIIVPGSWNLLLCFNYESNVHVVYLNSDTYFFCFNIPSYKHDLYFDKNTNILTFSSMYNNNFYKVYWTNLLKIFNSFSRPFFLKIKFRGKGYYIYKNKRNTIAPQFGYAHRLYIYSYFVTVKFLTKTNIFIFGLIKTDVILGANAVKMMRPINIFTGKGVRFSRQIVYKKAGKVSLYR